ncbi:MAG: hypothetical protein JWN25_3512 [Verrucomicrobiales bacterium]|nr:hypothetical protein [Verrucomicrobiales bacterium]
MPSQAKIKSAAAEYQSTGLAAFCSRLGPVESVIHLGSAESLIEFPGISSLPGLEKFLIAYRDRILVPVELPAILSAYDLTVKQHALELISLDQEMASAMPSDSFSEASSRVGKAQLKRLRPLKDSRLIQKYIAALEEGRVRGWHTLVYGLSLATYSIPIVQGLQNYCEQTLGSFANAGIQKLNLPEQTLESILEPALEALPLLIQGCIEKCALK